MARSKTPVVLRVPDLGNLSPEQREWLDERICDVAEFAFSFPLDEAVKNQSEKGEDDE